MMKTFDKDGSGGIGRKSPNPTNFSNHKSREYLSNGISKYNSPEEVKNGKLEQVALGSERKKGILTERQPGDEFVPISINRAKKLKPKILPIVNESLIDTILLMKECENPKKQETPIHNPSSDVHSEAKAPPTVKKSASKPTSANTSRARSDQRKHSESKVNKLDKGRHQ